jgi:hypothetical protein
MPAQFWLNLLNEYDLRRAAASPALRQLKPPGGKMKEEERRSALGSHPSRKNKDAARVGHPCRDFGLCYPLI